VRRVKAKWCARDDGEVETRPELVVIAETIAQTDSKDLVVLGRVLVSVSEVGHPRVRREPTLIGHQRQSLRRKLERVRRWLLARGIAGAIELDVVDKKLTGECAEFVEAQR